MVNNGEFDWCSSISLIVNETINKRKSIEDIPSLSVTSKQCRKQDIISW